MKTRRNHRKTTTGRRKRHVKQQRVQTRINHRKGAVSTGRRHKFFKRGGQFGTYRDGNSTNSVRTASLSQINTDLQQKKAEYEKLAVQKAKQELAQINYRAVVDFVEKIVPKNTSSIIDFGNIRLTVKELDKKDFYIGDVKIDQTSVTIKINDVTVKFYINYDGNTVVIYVDDMLYGYVMIKINGTNYESDNRGIYNPSVSIAIIQDLKVSSAT